jgi:ATP/maltotriose-dependent transcriptional regulator MalT
MTVAEVHEEVGSLRALGGPTSTFAVGFVVRRAVIEVLVGSTGQLVLVAAPAGYGKTSHVAAWSQRDGRPVIRVGLDASCNNPDIFVPTVLGELSLVADFSLGPYLKRSSATHERATPIAPAIAKLLRSCTTPFILVLDDVHVIDRPEVTDLIRTIAANVPPASTVVLVGHTVGHLDLSSVKAYSGAAEVGPHELALDVEDARELFDQLDVAADDERLADVVEHSDGWPLGIRLAALTDRLSAVSERWIGSAPHCRDGRDGAEATFGQDEWLDTLSNEMPDHLARGGGPDTTLMPGDMDSSRRLACDRVLVLVDRAGATALVDGAMRIAHNASAPALVTSDVERLAIRRRDGGLALQNGVTLTTAELKVLPYLPTNLTFERIAEQLYVSRNTVKSHVAAMYRKLGVSCRHDAVERARIVGLLVDGGDQTTT